MIVYRAYLLIEDYGSYQEFFRSPYFISEELAHDFIKQSGVMPDETDYQWEIQTKTILEEPVAPFDITDYEAYHEFDSE